MKTEHLAQLDIKKLEKKNENDSSYINSFENNKYKVKETISHFLPYPLNEFMMGSIGDIILLLIGAILIVFIMKILGFAFRIIIKIIYILLILGSLYILYITYFMK